ncbi:MAG: hypothetical protein WBF90_00680 [Rivularia sp. (in: cyanobacteria)]
MSLRVLSYGASSLGLLLIAIPVLPSTIGSIQNAIRAQQLEVEQKLAQDNIKRREELKRFGYHERQQTLDKASKIGEHIEYKQITVENYSFSVNHPPKLDMRAFKPNEHIQVFDNNGVCIGRIRNQKFEFKVHYLNTCLTINPIDKTQGRNQ